MFTYIASLTAPLLVCYIFQISLVGEDMSFHCFFSGGISPHQRRKVVDHSRHVFVGGACRKDFAQKVLFVRTHLGSLLLWGVIAFV